MTAVINLLILCVTGSGVEGLPKLEKVWRTDIGGQSHQLHFTAKGELLLNITTHVMDGKTFVKKYDAVKSLCPEGKLDSVMKFPDFCRSFVLVPDGRRCVILSGYQGKDIEIWDVRTGKRLHATRNEVFKNSFSHLAVDPAGKHLLVRHQGGVEQRDLNHLDSITKLPEPVDATVYLQELYFSKPGKPRALYIRNYNYKDEPGELLIWDFESQQFIRQIKISDSPRFSGMTRDHEYLIHSDKSGTISLWKADCTAHNPDFVLQGHTKPFHYVALDLNKKLIITTSQDRSLMTWCTDTQKPLTLNTFPRIDSYMAIAFAPDGKHLFAHANVVKERPVNREGFVTMFKLPVR